MSIDLDNLFQQVINSNDQLQDKTVEMPTTSCGFDDLKSKQFDEIFSFQGNNSVSTFADELSTTSGKTIGNSTRNPLDWSLDTNLYDAKIENIKNQLTSDIQGKYLGL